MNNQILSFIEITEKVCQQLTILTKTEQDKRTALLDRNVSEIDNIVQHQQAMIMKLENLEAKRIIAQKEAGFAGKTSDEILKMVDAHTLDKLSGLFADMKSTANHLQNLNKFSQEIATTELKIINNASKTNKKNDHGIYRANGEKSGSLPSNTFQTNI